MLADETLATHSWQDRETSNEADTLEKVVQALMGHDYLNYHCYGFGATQNQNCQFCGEEREEFGHVVRECTALEKELMDACQEVQANQLPPDAKGLA